LQENATQYGGKRPAHTAFEVVNTGSESQHEIDSITALENFVLGFRLGVRMMAECMDENDGDIRTGGG